MRMRKVKWAVDYLENGSHRLVEKPQDNKGHWKEILNTDKIHVEIGCGKGNYSLNMSKLYKEEGFVAVEKNESAAGIASKKFDEYAKDEKLLLIHGDAANILEWFDKGEVDVIHLNFSDPWPKKRYAKRRLSSEKFLDTYRTILSEDGEIQMKTDNMDLFEYSVLEFEKNNFKLHEFSVNYRRAEHKEDVLTEYEEKFVEKGHPIFRAVWKK